jgi:hypothetical protein
MHCRAIRRRVAHVLKSSPRIWRLPDENPRDLGDGNWFRAILWYNEGMSTPSKIEAVAGPEDISEPPTEVSSITWKREYKGRMVTIFGSPRLGWNVQIDKREPIILGLTRARAIKHAKELIDQEQGKYHSRSTTETSRSGKLFPGSKDRSFPTVVSADRRRG